MDVDTLKAEVQAEVDRLAPALVDVSRAIHAHPEPAFEEHFAHDRLVAALQEAGLAVEPHAFGLDTAFRAEAGREGPVVAICCEYDALPGIGHACGHNVIAAAGLGAGLALARVAAAAGGRVVVLGTPAEEDGGGKQLMAEAGAFEGVDAALMVHPADADLILMTSLAIHGLDVTYTGAASHAAAAPWEGRNALDAAVLGYLNVAALRQHIRPQERVHGIFTKAGERANVVPRETAASWIVRSPDRTRLEALKARVLRCLEAGADAAGCTMDAHWRRVAYHEVRDCEPMMAAFAANAARLGRTLADPRQPGTPGVTGSTDMGNVSHLVPAIHPMLQVAPAGIPIHTPGFAEHAGGPGGDQAVVDGAKCLAMTAVDLWVGPLLDAARDHFGASS